jgi:hypothetical protein
MDEARGGLIVDAEQGGYGAVRRQANHRVWGQAAPLDEGRQAAGIATAAGDAEIRSSLGEGGAADGMIEPLSCPEPRCHLRRC